ncbi:MAG TPA: hypothetical protein VM008_15180 [Phycisphaerae bacterium]|nr:hypothetical protein [Phycisphaerae bacterium]
MLRFWRLFRLSLFVFVFLALGVYLAATTPWARIFGPAPDYTTLLHNGDPIVTAIYRYRAATNLWPEYLDDLVPRELPAAPAMKWFYTITRDGPSLAIDVDNTHTHLGYSFDTTSPEWRLFGSDTPRTLRSDINSPATHPALPSDSERIINELAELDRRIQREPTLIEHRRDKAALLKSLNRLPEARQTIEQAATDFPDNVWPKLATVALDPTPDAIAHFAHWTTDHPSLTHDYYLALLYRQTHDTDRALTTITEAATLPVELNPDDPNILAFYLWDMTRYALQQKQFTLVLQLTNAWQKASLAHTIEENSYLPLRAAANLALGNQQSAQSDLSLLDSLKTKTWAQNLPALQSAVAANNRSFLYDPGPTPAPFEIFPLPQ